MINSDLEKLISQALWEDATPAEGLALRLEACVDRLDNVHRLRRRRMNWTIGSIAASVLVAGIAMTEMERRNSSFTKDTFDDPREAAQFMASALGTVSREIHTTLENELGLFITELTKLSESTNNQKSDENEG